MSEISEGCIDEAFNALKNFSKEDLERYVRDVFARAKTYKDLDNSRAFDKAIEETNSDKLKSLFEDTTQTARNVMEFETNANLIRSGKADIGNLITLRGKFYGRSLSGSQKAEFEKMVKYVFSDLSNEEMDYFLDSRNHEDICDAHDGKKIENPISHKLGDKIKDWFTYRNAQMVLSGAMKFDEINEDRLFRAIHNQERIMNGNKSLIKLASERITKKYNPIGHKEAWKEEIKKGLDMMGTFKYTNAIDLDGNLDMAKADKILDRIYDSITTGKSEIFIRSVVANDRQAVANRSRMFFKFKDLRSQFEYNKTYGKGGLFDMLMSDVRSSSGKTGAAKVWGSNVYTMWNDLQHVQSETKPLSSGVNDKNNLMFKSLMEPDRLSVSPNLTKFFANIRSLSTMARLPLITLQSISDIGYISSFAQRMGVGYTRAWTNQLSHIFNTFKTEDRIRISKLMKTQVDSHLGYLGRWADANNATDLINKINSYYFKANFLEAFDKGNRIGIMHMMAQHLYENSNKGLDDLGLPLKNWINKFLDKNEWDVLRKNNQGKLFTTDNVDTLSDSTLREFYGKTEKSIPLSELRDDLYRKVHSMFTVAGENAVLSPGEFEKTFMASGTPGRLGTELMRTFMHFKMYTVAYIDRVLVQGYNDSDANSQKLKWATSMLMGTIPLSVLSTYLGNVAMGLSMPDIGDMSIPQREQYALSILQPSLSLFGSLLDPKNQNSSVISSLLNSPSFRLLNDAVAAPLALINGDPKRAAKSLIKASDYFLPLQNVPFLSPLLRQAMGDEAHLQPGQTHLFGQ